MTESAYFTRNLSTRVPTLLSARENIFSLWSRDLLRSRVFPLQTMLCVLFHLCFCLNFLTKTRNRGCLELCLLDCATVDVFYYIHLRFSARRRRRYRTFEYRDHHHQLSSSVSHVDCLVNSVYPRDDAGRFSCIFARRACRYNLRSTYTEHTNFDHVASLALA